ncbi:UNVERIFIED_CONTAM: hypothetical protein Slati_1122900 [Sesamum latifolium]|uniref:Retrotransposon gag domain-containing protein n=1 Tax=Sesamum latifolium TaxID=2727402 RepID=A0AAW2XCD9_9LAMI
MVVPEQADRALAISRPDAVEGHTKKLPAQAGDVPPQWLARLESLQKGLQDIQYQVMGAPTEEQTSIPFTEGVMADELPVNCRTSAIAEYDDTTNLNERLPRFENAALLHRYTDGIKCRATQEVKASAFAQGLMDGDFFKSLAKKPTTKFDVLLARAAKYINMEDAQASNREGRGEKRKENKDKGPSKKPKMDSKDKKPVWQRVNAVYTPLTIPITQALMTVEGKCLLSRPRSYKDGPRQPKSDKFCRFHNEYGHTTEECIHLKSEIERLIQNGYLQEYVCWGKAKGTGPYQKYKTDKGKEVKNPSPGSLVKDIPRSSMMEKAEVNDPPRKGVIRMIVGGPAGGDSQRAR